MIPRHTHPANPEWASAKLVDLPYRWKKRLFKKWEKVRNDFKPDLGAEGDATRKAATWLQEMLSQLKAVGSVPLDASDHDIIARAETMSEHCNSLAEVFHDRKSLRAAMERVLAANSVPAWKGEADKIEVKGNACATRECRDQTDASAIARYVDAFWWRRQIRNLHARSVEGAAISIGYVNKTRDIYVSNESLVRRVQQNKRNAAMLENTVVRNESGDEFKLAELAAKSTSNKAIKRGELMTRIAGFERIARECSHEGLFFTMTAPSRMHKWRTVAGGRVVENSKYDGTLPDAAQKYHSKVFARLRSALDRRGIKWYGFRIAEPNHDGTPHWHVLVFMDKKWPGDSERAALPRVCALIRRYALRDSGSEPGAKKHRVDFEKIDWSKGGSAAAYIAKYVSKNIDGYGVGKDLYGNDVFETCHRVEAWAATWRIRQFQQVGGPPVTVWRELRRVKEVPKDAPEHLIEAHSAVNKIARVEGGNASVAWDRYVKAQGGVFLGRAYRIRLAKEERAGTGRYGEPMGPAPVGVETVGVKLIRDGICVYEKTVTWLVKSVRYVWEVIVRRSSESHAGIARAWTRVNNCTRPDFGNIQKGFSNVPELLGPMPRVASAEFYGPINWPELQKEVLCVDSVI